MGDPTEDRTQPCPIPGAHLHTRVRRQRIVVNQRDVALPSYDLRSLLLLRSRPPPSRRLRRVAGGRVGSGAGEERTKDVGGCRLTLAEGSPPEARTASSS